MLRFCVHAVTGSCLSLNDAFKDPNDTVYDKSYRREMEGKL
jgi:hypothetical protein